MVVVVVVVEVVEVVEGEWGHGKLSYVPSPHAPPLRDVFAVMSVLFFCLFGDVLVCWQDEFRRAGRDCRSLRGVSVACVPHVVRANFLR